jgi:hypothetical protein
MKNNLVNISENFFINGYLTGKIIDQKIISKINEISNNFINNDLNDNNFFFKEEKINQFDLKPNTWEYDKIFTDMLLNTGLINFLNMVTNQNLLLTDIRARIIKKDEKIKPWGYIAPHRDSYYQVDRWKGPKLPSYKLILYPLIGKNNEMLRIFPSSHRKMSNIKNGSLSDRIMAFFNTYKSIYKSADNFCFFNGTLRHWPLKEKSEEGSLRIIYVFRDSRYYDEHKDNALTNFFNNNKKLNYDFNNSKIVIDNTNLKY